ncbi:MAG: malectin domain-containing carbohydrate-binding protein [Planctomycetota bacterium]
MSRRTCFLVLISCCAALAVIGCSAMQGPKGGNPSVTIVSPSDATIPERLAAKEIRRYLYLRTGKVVPIVQSDGRLPSTAHLIVVGQEGRPAVEKLAGRDTGLAALVNALGSEQYLLKTFDLANRQVVLVAGGDPIGTLYAAYRFAEHLGVRFYLHGDVVPDERIALRIPDLDERGKPLFETRGIQPFHDFPEGPDWWNADDYKAIMAQLPKLRMNFFGLHTYPQGGVGPEPTVWIGLPGDFNEDGTVKFSYPSRHFTTANVTGAWGYEPTKTGDYTFGAGQMFESDDYGPDYMHGMNPWTQLSGEKANELFDRMGNTLAEAFGYAHALGVKTCVGTETPLIIPDAVRERIKAMGKDPSDPAVAQELYEGMFRRIAKAYPLDYYWFWTPEGWTWGNPKDEEVEATAADFRAAIAAAQRVNAPFTLATCGWVLGPPKDRALFDNVLPKEMPMSCINRNVGFAPVESGFARVEGRPKWAIPWLEDDPALIIPQLWVGRMRRDAADSLAYGCTGLLGIHWRTRILGPNVSALAHAAWEQRGWNPDFGKAIQPPQPKLTEGREGGNVASFPNNQIADTENDPLYQTVVWDVKAYRLKVPDATYTVTLKFCEPHYEAAGKRVFGVELQGKKVIDRLDVFAETGKNRALDYTFEGIKTENGFLEISFENVVEFPCIAAFVVQGRDVTRKINCGGPAHEDYQADLPAAESDDRPRDLPAYDFYVDWASAQFGPAAAEQIARLFTSLDGGPTTAERGQRGASLPRPSTWVKGPGGINPDERPWEQVSKEYAFVEELAKLRPRVKGGGRLERFDYWLNNFRYLRAVGQVNCTWARFNAAMKKVKDEKEPEARRRLARRTALPIRKELVAQVADVHRYLLATVTTNGGMGNVTNWQQHVMPMLLTGPGNELAEILGEDLPADAIPSKAYPAEAGLRLIVPTVRSSLMADEGLELKAIVLASDQPGDVAMYWRPMGKGEYKRTPLTHVARGVYSVQIPAEKIKSDLEYYIKASSADGREITFPASAPNISQTVVVLKERL